VFSLQDEDGQWLSLRYDLTAPLARYVAENFQRLPKPFRRYQVGSVWRNEKPGPGRYREFTQFDADTVGSDSAAAESELLMMTCDVLEELGIKRGEYIAKINSRRLLDTVLKAAEIDQSQHNGVLRAIDKFDRLGEGGVRLLLGPGRKDESGDFTPGIGLDDIQVSHVMDLLVGPTERFETTLAVHDLQPIMKNLRECGYEADRVVIDTSIIRGLEYYTGPVFEVQLTFPVANALGESVVFGSVAGGGRYDDLIARFTGQKVAAAGISIGVSRLLSARRTRDFSCLEPLIVVLSLGDVKRSFAIAAELRLALKKEKVRVETYVGTKRFGEQLKYADRRGAAVAVIQGSDELAQEPEKVTIKDLVMGAELAKSVESRAAWVADRPAQVTVPRAELVSHVLKLLQHRLP
jgi:histidyl-tRNA synthetase